MMAYCKICGRPIKDGTSICKREQCLRVSSYLRQRDYYRDDIYWWLWIEEHTLKDFLEGKKNYYILDRLQTFHQSFVKAWEEGNLPRLTPKEHRVLAVLRVNEMLALKRYSEDLQRAVLERFMVILHTDEERDTVWLNINR